MLSNDSVKHVETILTGTKEWFRGRVATIVNHIVQEAFSIIHVAGKYRSVARRW